MNESWQELCFLTIREAGNLFRSRKLSPVELTEAHLDAINRLDPTLRTYVTLMPERALAQARQAERGMLNGDFRGPLHGIPYALKDLFYTAGVTTEAHSKVMEGFTPKFDAHAVTQMQQAGAVLLGKQAMGEFAVGSLETALYPRPRNPWNIGYDTGGSSSGSAASVASGLAMASLGTDTGGSIRGPAANCGVVGLKPTYGRVSRHGVVPLSWSLDHCGPLTRTVEDAALVLQAIAGHDPRDPTSSTTQVPDYATALSGGVHGLVIGVPRSFFAAGEVGADPQILDAFDKAMQVFEDLGAQIRDIDVPSLHYYRMAHTTIMLSEAYSIHRINLVQRPDDYAHSTWNHLASGAVFTASDYVHAQRIRSRMRLEFHATLDQVDVIALPSSHRTAWPIGDGDAVGTLEPQNFRACFDMTGMPAVTLSCGFTREGLPIGLQLAGRPFDEATVLRAANAYEQQAGWFKRRPPSTTARSVS